MPVVTIENVYRAGIADQTSTRIRVDKNVVYQDEPNSLLESTVESVLLACGISVNVEDVDDDR